MHTCLHKLYNKLIYSIFFSIVRLWPPTACVRILMTLEPFLRIRGKKWHSWEHSFNTWIRLLWKVSYEMEESFKNYISLNGGYHLKGVTYSTDGYISFMEGVIRNERIIQHPCMYLWRVSYEFNKSPNTESFSWVESFNLKHSFNSC